MIHLSAFEGMGKKINITDLAMPETEHAGSYDPRSLVTPQRWTELIREMSNKESMTYGRDNLEVGHALAVLFPERKGEIPVDLERFDKLIETNHLDLIDGKKSLARDVGYFLRALGLYRKFIPDKVDKIFVDYPKFTEACHEMVSADIYEHYSGVFPHAEEFMLAAPHLFDPTKLNPRALEELATHLSREIEHHSQQGTEFMYGRVFGYILSYRTFFPDLAKQLVIRESDWRTMVKSTRDAIGFRVDIYADYLVKIGVTTAQEVKVGHSGLELSFQEQEKPVEQPPEQRKF